MENRVATATGPSAGTGFTFHYGPQGGRIRKTGTVGYGSQWVDYYGPELESSYVGSAFHTDRYVLWGGQRIVKVHDGELVYLHPDVEGSVSVYSSSAGIPLERRTYAPYGSLYPAPTGSTLTFTPRYGYAGSEEDHNLGLLHLGPREDSTSLGLMLQPDPLGPQGRSPKELNPYAYADFNPIFYKDPSGYVPDEDIPEPGGPYTAWEIDQGEGGFGSSEPVLQEPGGGGSSGDATTDTATTDSTSQDASTSDSSSKESNSNNAKGKAGTPAAGPPSDVTPQAEGNAGSEGSGRGGAGGATGTAANSPPTDVTPQARGGVSSSGSSGGPSVQGGGQGGERGTIVVDEHGNAVVTPPGGRVDSSPDGRFVQAKDAEGQPTGVRLDGPHNPARHPDPRAQAPHAHVPGVTNEDGTPWLPVYPKGGT